MIPVLGDSDTAGLMAAVTVLAVMCALGGVVHVSLPYLARHSTKDGSDTNVTRILTASRGPTALFLVILGLFLSYFMVIQHPHPTFDFANDHDTWALRIWLLTIVAQVSYLAVRVIQALLHLYVVGISGDTVTGLHDRLLVQVGWVVPLLVYSVGLIVMLDLLGVAITPLITGLGIGGIAVALALQPTLSNLFSGAFMVSEGELNVGDFIELDGGPSGTVVGVGWRSTKIRDRFNNLIMVPNATMMDTVMTNYFSDSKAVTVMVPCGVSYDSDLERVESVTLEVASEVRDALDEAVDDFDPLFRLVAFGTSNIDFMAIMQAHDRPASFVVRHALIKRLSSRFRGENIEINYPVRKLVAPEKSLAAGDILDSETRAGGMSAASEL